MVERRSHIRWGGRSAGLVWAVVLAAVIFEAATVRAADPDPNMQAVHAVCGSCHTAELFLNQVRSWDRWNDVFADMTRLGANGTDDQLERVTTYFLESLTLVNVNTSPLDELTGVLGVSDETADAIITRRERQPFANVAQLCEVPGVDRDTIEKRKSRILF